MEYILIQAKETFAWASLTENVNIYYLDDTEMRYLSPDYINNNYDDIWKNYNGILYYIDNNNHFADAMYYINSL